MFKLLPLLTKVKSIASNPLVFGAGVGAYTGYREGKGIISKTLQDIIYSTKDSYRRFLSADKVPSLKSADLNDALAVKKTLLDKENKLIDEFFSVSSEEGPFKFSTKDLDINIHPRDRILELSPSVSSIIEQAKNITGNPDIIPKEETRKLLAGPIGKNVAVSLLLAGGAAYTPALVNRIKEKIKESGVTKKTASILKEELIKRAEDMTIESITKSVNKDNLDNIASRCSYSYNTSNKRGV